jgi:toxin ParE1/3/4
VTALAWHPIARQELFEASDFYERESAGLGSAFLDAVESTLRMLSAHPKSGRIVLGQARNKVVSKFPYSLVYRLPDGASGRADTIVILAVSHHKRRPLYWAARL